VSLLTALHLSPHEDDVVTLKFGGGGGGAGGARSHDLTLCMPLKTSLCAALQRAFTTAQGSVRVGRLLEELDAFAGGVAARHSAPLWAAFLRRQYRLWD
jgi:hypothetical protein